MPNVTTQSFVRTSPPDRDIILRRDFSKCLIRCTQAVLKEVTI
jgi:hypothetical protein